MFDLKDNTPKFDKALEHLKKDISSIRTNRATPALIENLLVNVYDSKMPLNQVASILAPEPRMLSVEPWDKSIIKDVEKSIQTASLGLSVANKGTFLRVTIPPMTEESRKELVKVLAGKLEHARGAIRGTRDSVKEAILKAAKEKQVSEDERYKLIDELDEMTREYNDKIKEIGERKEEEIAL